MTLKPHHRWLIDQIETLEAPPLEEQHRRAPDSLFPGGVHDRQACPVCGKYLPQAG